MTVSTKLSGRWSRRLDRPHSDERKTATIVDTRLELFSGLSDRELARVARLFTLVDVESGRVLGREGQVGREFVVVVSGQVAASVGGEPLAVLEAGHHFGALPMLDPMKEPTRRATFHAMAPTRIAVANRAEFNTLLSQFPTIDGRIRALAERRQAYFDEINECRAHAATNDAATDYPVDAGAVG